MWTEKLENDEVYRVSIKPGTIGAGVAVRGPEAAADGPADAERWARARQHRGGRLARAVPVHTLRHRHTQVSGQ